MFKIITDKSFRKNLLFAGFTLLLLFVVWLKWLNIYTNHDDFIRVPDFNGVHILEGSESGFLKAMARELCVHQGL